MGLIRYLCGHISGYHKLSSTKFGLWGYFILLYQYMVFKALKCKKVACDVIISVLYFPDGISHPVFPTLVFPAQPRKGLSEKLKVVWELCDKTFYNIIFFSHFLRWICKTFQRSKKTPTPSLAQPKQTPKDADAIPTNLHPTTRLLHTSTHLQAATTASTTTGWTKLSISNSCNNSTKTCIFAKKLPKQWRTCLSTNSTLLL